MAAKRTTHCPNGHEYTKENTRYTSRSRQYRDGTPYTDIQKHCIQCDKDYDTNNKEKGLQRSRRYQESNPEKVREASRLSMKKRNKELRREAIEAYGGKCVCCGETTPEFLHFDHVNNDGAAHRKELGGHGGSMLILRWAKKNSWPDKIQLLCHNCGMAKAWYGECPHGGDSN